MRSSRVLAVFALLCLVSSLHLSDVSGQTIAAPETSIFSQWSPQRWLPAGSACNKDEWLTASFDVGWMTTPNRIHLGYDGLVPPGGCISSFFVYPLSGVQVAAAVPIALTDQSAVRVYGAYLIANNPKANQDLTWTITVPGTRVWRHSRTELYKIGGEMLYRMSGETALVAGFRWESLLTNFGDPNPDYQFTVPGMEAQTTLAIYEPYVGVRLTPGTKSSGLTLQFVGFPWLFATVQHLNVCNNNGVPFAHTGSQNATRGYFVEASAEYRLSLLQGLEAAAFIDWNLYHGGCTITIDRHEGGATPQVTSATAAWSHQVETLVLGCKLAASWKMPF